MILLYGTVLNGSFTKVDALGKVVLMNLLIELPLWNTH